MISLRQFLSFIQIRKILNKMISRVYSETKYCFKFKRTAEHYVHWVQIPAPKVYEHGSITYLGISFFTKLVKKCNKCKLINIDFL